MIVVYAANETDFTHNGLGPVDPILCEVSEVLNGTWELEISHARDEGGKCDRLQIGNIVKAPVPAGYTPAIHRGGSADKEIWKVNVSSGNLNLRSGPGTSYGKISKYPKNTEVVVLDKSDSSWYEVTTPDGNHGWMRSSYLVYVRTETAEEADEVARESQALRDQLFRIYRIEQGITTVNVYARHIFYDLMDNLIDNYQGTGVTGAAAAEAILSHCRGADHGFTMYSDLTGTADVDFADKNPVDALLGSDGLTETYTAEIARDWYDIYAVERVGRDTDIVIRQGKNLTDLTGDLDMTDAVTRIVPIGATKNGDKLYLPEVYVEKQDGTEYPTVKWGILQVSDAKVGKDGMTTDQAYAKMREAAQAEFDKGCDLPAYTIDVDFVNLGDTLEYADYGLLYELSIGDSVRVICESADIDTRLRMTEYVYDCLAGRYTSCKLGTIEDYTSAVAKAAGGSSGVKVAGSTLTPAAHQADSTASSVSDLRGDFNTLLGKLQAAGLMRSE